MSILAELRANRRKKNRLEKQVQAIDNERDVLIRRAFDEGLTGVEIGVAAEVTTGRTYQIRDGTR